jgi:hypothetical protein
MNTKYERLIAATEVNEASDVQLVEYKDVNNIKNIRIRRFARKKQSITALI